MSVKEKQKIANAASKTGKKYNKLMDLGDKLTAREAIQKARSEVKRPAYIKPKVAPPLHDIGKYQHSGPGLKDFAARKTAEHQAGMAQKAAPEAEKVTSKAIQKIAPKAEKVVSRLGTKGKLIAGGTAAVAGLAALAISKHRAAAKAKLLAAQKVKK
jgi:hypothetical protein